MEKEHEVVHVERNQRQLARKQFIVAMLEGRTCAGSKRRITLACSKEILDDLDTLLWLFHEFSRPLCDSTIEIFQWLARYLRSVFASLWPASCRSPHESRREHRPVRWLLAIVTHILPILTSVLE